MDNTPFFSIIIPTYNRAHLIRRPIDSVIAQTYTNWELIIVDDGSTDDTKAIVESYHDDRIRYIWQENQERSVARNHGIQVANGEWICFQDSDDEYLPEHLEVLNNGISSFPECKLFRTGMFIFVDGKLSKTPKFDVDNEYELYPFDAFTTFTFKVEILENYQFKRELINSQDLHLLLRVNEKYNLKILKTYTNIYHYNAQNGAGLGEQYFKIHQSKIICFTDLLNQNLKNKRNYLIRKLCLSNILILSGHIRYNKFKILLAMWDNAKCFTKYPLNYISLIKRILFVMYSEKVLKRTFDYRF